MTLSFFLLASIMVYSKYRSVFFMLSKILYRQTHTLSPSLIPYSLNPVWIGFCLERRDTILLVCNAASTAITRKIDSLNQHPSNIELLGLPETSYLVSCVHYILLWFFFRRIFIPCCVLSLMVATTTINLVNSLPWLYLYLLF